MGIETECRKGLMKVNGTAGDHEIVDGKEIEKVDMLGYKQDQMFAAEM